MASSPPPTPARAASSSPPTLAPQASIDKRAGPFDFLWLLERCADYGGERPLWQKGGSALSDFRSDPPPPPLQLLVPEAVAFEPQDSKGRSNPHAIFFTDRGGFLRGARRCMKQGSQLCKGLLRLMRHRQPDVTLTHNLGIVFEQHHLLTGAKAWVDKPFTYSGIPKEMEGATFFAGPFSSVPTGELLLSAPVHGMAYVWSEDKADTNGGLPSIGWEVVTGGMTFGNNRVMKIYRNILTAGASIVIPVTFMWIGGVAFQPHDLAEEEAQSKSPLDLRGSISSNGGSGMNRRNSAAHEASPELSAGTKKKAKATKRGESNAAGHWKLTFYNGTAKRISNDEVASHFGATDDGRTSQWPTGARLLQAHFWSGQKLQGAEQSILYKYDALRAEASAEHHGIADNILNHFERYSFMTDVACHAMVSSAPIQISQHLAYFCMLELVSGDFEFIRDIHNQLWIVDARNIFVIPATRSVDGGGASSTAQVAEGKGSVSHKLPRYLSEEALHNLKVSEAAGNKCQRMTELMLGHFKKVKDATGMDDMMRKTDEVQEISIPMLSGTDRRCYARTFGVKKEKKPDVAINVGLTQSAQQRRHPKMPKQGGFIGRGRLVTGALPQPLSAPPQMPGSARRPAARPQALAATALSNTNGSSSAWATPRATPGGPGGGSSAAPRAAPGGLHTGSVAWAASPRATPGGPNGGTAAPRPTPGHDSVRMGKTASKGHSERTPRSRMRTLNFDEEGASGADEGGGVGIEIVLPESAQKLLTNSGPGLRPNGPTLDIVGPPAARAQGTGLTSRRTSGRTEVRAVQVPSGVAAVLAPNPAPNFLSLF